MEKWKFVSISIRFLVLSNIALIAGVLFTQASKPIAMRVFSTFRLSSLALLVLLPLEYILRRTTDARRRGLILDTMLSALMFAVWFTISSATF
jgi:hypothetical protein